MPKTFETVAMAQRMADRRLPPSVYVSLVGSSQRGQTAQENVDAFSRLAFAPVVVGQPAKRDLTTTVLGQDLAFPVLISPTGVQAVHPDGELAVARAAASRGIPIGLSSFGSVAVEKVTATGAATFFQVYWVDGRDQILARIQRARAAGAKGLILTTDWSFANGRDWGTPQIPASVGVRTALRFAPELVRRPRYLARWVRAGQRPALTAPNIARSATDPVEGFTVAYARYAQTPPATWEDVSWLVEEWGGPLLLKGVTRVDDARRAVDAGVSAISASNHGGNNLDGTPASIRMLGPIADAVGDQVEVLMDGGVRRGSDVVKAIALGARAVLVGRAPLWGLAVAGQDGVAQVLDILRSGIDSALMGLGVRSVHDLAADHLVVPEGFRLALGAAR